jgi:translation initiation factor 3 subunit E
LKYGKLLYELGKYSDAKLILSDYYKIGLDSKKNLSKVILAIWIVLAINILTNNWNEVLENIEQLKLTIEHLKESLEEDFKKANLDSGEKLDINFKHILLHRAYLLHWATFLFLDQKIGLNYYRKLIFEEKHFTLLESSFYYLIKYVIVVSIVTKNKESIKHLKLVLDSSQNTAKNDVFTQLFKNIYFNFDLKTSFNLVQECVAEMKGDYFLNSYADEFNLRCREVLLEDYLMLNKSVNAKYFFLY